MVRIPQAHEVSPEDQRFEEATKTWAGVVATHRLGDGDWTPVAPASR